MKEHLLLFPFALFLIILPFPHTIVIRMLTLTLLFLIALRIWWIQRPYNEPLPGKRVIGLWVAVCLLSLTYAIDPVYSLKEMKGELLNTLGAFFAFFVIAGNMERAKYLLRAIATGLIIIGGWAAIAWIFNDFSWDETGGYGGIGIFSTYLATILPTMIWLSMCDSNRNWRRIAIALLPFVFLLAYATKQRAVWPALGAEIFICWFLLVRLGKLPKPRFSWLGVFIISAAITIGITNQIHEERTQGSSQMASDDRISFWPDVVKNITEHPMSGGGFGRNAMKKAYPELIPEYNSWLWHSHNLFLNYGISMGLPGIVAIILLFGFWGRFFWRAATQDQSLAGMAGLAVVAGVVIRNQTNDFFVRDMSLLFWAQVGILARIYIHDIRARRVTA